MQNDSLCVLKKPGTPPTVTFTANGQSNPNSITVAPGQTVHLVATFSPPGSYLLSAINDSGQNALTSQDASSPKTYDFNTPANPASPSFSPFTFTAAVQTSDVGWANSYGKTFTVTVANPVAPTASLTQTCGLGNCPQTTAGDNFTAGWNFSDPAGTCTLYKTVNGGGAQTYIYRNADGTCGGSSSNDRNPGVSNSCQANPSVVGTHVWTLDCTGPSGTAQATMTHTVVASVCPAGTSGTYPDCTCNNGLDYSTYPSCSCPGTQIQSGGQCVNPGSISDFHANPARVQKGNATTLSWTVSGMSSCGVTGTDGTTQAAQSAASAADGTHSAQATVSKATTYTLMCNDSATSLSSSVTVTLVPVYKEN